MKNKRAYQVCSRCVMDTSASDIVFDSDGVCNYCSEFLERSGHIVFKDPVLREQELAHFVKRVKADGRGKRYDCVIGVSGGVDSSWALVQAVKLGLRPLAVHMDNGWNSELAQNNIANLVRGLGVDLYTHVIDWHEYKNLMQAFFEAHVIDVELLYDNAMLAVNYKMASSYKLHNILSGTNQATEGLRIPKTWNWLKYDKKNIKALSAKFTNQKIVTFPAIGTLDYIYYEYIKKIKWISFLDYFEYNKFDVLDNLENNYSYKRYPYKHYESIFTRFYQGYILPKKFNVDKRRPHLSVLIVSGQMSRDEAIIQLESIPYPSINELEEDIRYFLIKMGWSRHQLDDYIEAVEIRHDHYKSEIKLWNLAVQSYKFLR
ncbi:MAG: N-acetyl sugar amidotransferase [Desulfomicrobium sp.]|nr:N-acetyl sugar amidotransferase [Desulfomicrobium sp.]